jgi:hypothetical protein
MGMAITTIDQALAGMKPPVEFYKALSGNMVAGRPFSYFYSNGIPGPAAAPSPGIGGAALTSYAGQLPYTNPSSGYSYLARFVGQCTQAGTLVLADRLWHNSGYTITSNTEQTHTGAADIPARDVNGAALGHGVFAAVEVSSAVGAGTPTLTLKYNNQDNTEKTATNVIATVASSVAGTFYPIGLAAGDTGIRRAVSLTLSATWTSGTIHTVLYRPIARLQLGANAPWALDLLTSGMPRVFDNAVPFLYFIPNTTTSSTIHGQVIYTHG